MSPWLRMCTSLADDISPIPSTHVGQLTAPAPEGCNTFLFYRHLSSHTNTQRHVDIQLRVIKGCSKVNTMGLDDLVQRGSVWLACAMLWVESLIHVNESFSITSSSPICFHFKYGQQVKKKHNVLGWRSSSISQCLAVMCWGHGSHIYHHE